MREIVIVARGAFGRRAEDRESLVHDRRALEARVRFWDELRDGQREAEAEAKSELVVAPLPHERGA